MGKLSLANEVWMFLRQNKKLWLLPIVVVLVLLGVLLIFAQSSALAPFIYTIF
jgi:drug/metabolite transporter superfamily protein YnfA